MEVADRIAVMNKVQGKTLEGAELLHADAKAVQAAGASLLVLLDAQRERLAAEDAQAQAEVDLYRGIVAIYKALGGGWQPDTVVASNR